MGIVLLVSVGTLQLILFGAGTTAVVVGETAGKLLACSICGEPRPGMFGGDLTGVEICSFSGLIKGDIGVDVLLQGVTGDSACSELLLLLVLVISSGLTRKQKVIH